MPVYLPTPTSGTTTLDLIEATRRHLLSGAGETLNQIEACDAVTTSVAFARTTTAIQPGTLLSVGLETMFAWGAAAAGTTTVEVLRGYQGSTATAHDAGELVRIGPPHSDYAILSALNAEIDALSSSGIFRMKVLDFTTSTVGARTYDVDPDALDLYDLRIDTDNTSNDWPQVSSFTFLPSLPTGEFTSGNALRIDSAVATGRPARLLYKAALGHLTALGDDAEIATGLLASALDLPPLGAAWRLTMPSEIQRNQTRHQGDSRRAEEVPQGAKMRSALGIAQIRATRIREERNNLLRRWPERGRR